MLFKYRINLEIEVEFEGPLLGVDNTGQKRKSVDAIAKKSLQEMISNKSTIVTLVKDVDLENIKGRITGLKHLGKSENNKY